MAKLVSVYSEAVSAFVPEPPAPAAAPIPLPISVVTEIYSDLNQYTPKTVAKLTDIDSVFQSVGNILATPTYTRLFNPEFGSEIMGLLFEPMGEVVVIQLYDAIIGAIERWEHRVVVLPDVSEVIPFYDDNYYEVNIALEIIGLPGSYTYMGTLLRSMTGT
jgi:phage baseplate assembly protein W